MDDTTDRITTDKIQQKLLPRHGLGAIFNRPLPHFTQQEAVVYSTPPLLHSYLEDEKSFSRKQALLLLKRFSLLVLKEKWLLFLASTAFLCSIITTLLSPRIFGGLVDNALLPKDLSMLYVLTTAFLAIELVKSLSIGIKTYLFTKLGQQVMHDIRVRLYSQFQQLPFSRIDKTPVGTLISRLTTDVKYLSDLFQNGFIQILTELITVVAIIIAMFVLDWRLSLVSLLFFPIVIWCAITLSKKLYVCHRRLRRYLTGFNAFLSDTLTGYDVVRSFNREDVTDQMGQWLVDAHAESQLQRIYANALFHPMMTLMNGLGVLLILQLGSYLVARGELAPGEVVTFLFYLLWVFWPIVHAVNRIDSVLAGVASLERVFEALDWETENNKSKTTAITYATSESFPKIEFRDVWFAYNNEEWILQGVSFTLEAGKSLGVVGPTGSGKSTIMSLLLRFYSPQRGVILLDGKPLNEFSVEEIRTRLALIHQEPLLFPGTIEQNITLWRDTNQTRLAELLDHPTFKKLRVLFAKDESTLKQTSTKNQKSEHTLSHGTVQLLSFARALYNQPEILVLDEATAHIDPMLDNELNESLKTLLPNATILTIAHRLSSVFDAHEIVVLNHGKITERGSHTFLAKNNGLYARMLKSQDAISGNSIKL
jgi:ATP-binding cassette, subfamily B, multidrug efflux pump